MAEVLEQDMSGSDSDSMDDMMIFPLGELDDDADVEDAGGDSRIHAESSGDDETESKRKAELPFSKFKPVTLRERRRSKLGLGGEFSKLNMNIVDRLHSVDSGFDEENTTSSANNNFSSVIKSTDSPKIKWYKAIRMIKTMKDPWEKLKIIALPEETCIRHRYNALKRAWKVDEVSVKMEKESFNHGAMRSCFRLKKLPGGSRRRNWMKAHNYVAKKYMEDVSRDVYFEDVRLQMDAKLWGEEYNRFNPPKKVDIFQMSILEFKDQPGKPLYHLEHFIEGDYIKYNSNSGFVDESLRFTPQAFSHFTFERSGHQLIVVDVQGVGDLWTDPQVHTQDGTGYGDGNLGPKGMALFFHSHVCNSICKSLNLSKFDLAPSEIASQSHFKRLNERRHTVVKGTEQIVYSASPSEKTDLLSFLAARSRSRTNSALSDIMSEGSEVESISRQNGLHHHAIIEEEEEEEEEDEGHYGNGDPHSPSGASSPIPMSHMGHHRHGGLLGRSIEEFSGRFTSEDEPMSPDSFHSRSRIRFDSEMSLERSDLARLKTMSECSDLSLTERFFLMQSETDDIISPEEEAQIIRHMNMKNHRASCVADEINFRKDQNIKTVGDSVLGMTHHECAKYHELGRFAKSETDIDWDAAIFHETMAADLGIMEAIITIARIHLGMQTDILVNCKVPDNPENIEKGIEYMELGADLGDRAAIIFMAEAYETGRNLQIGKKKSYKYAVDWYQKAINTTREDEDGGYDACMSHPSYQLKAKVAEMFLDGGFDLDKDPSYAGDLYNEAGEEAMAAMKGRLASKYYMLSEEAYGQVEEE